MRFAPSGALPAVTGTAGRPVSSLPRMADPSLDAARRRGRVAAAGHRGGQGDPTGREAGARTARAHLDDPDPKVRASALGALSRLRKLTSADLDAALGDPHPLTRRRACELSQKLHACDPSPCLSDPDPAVVEAAAWALGERREESAVQALKRVAGGHPDPLCRESAVAALGCIGDRRGLPALLSALEDRPPIRRRAVIALASFDGPSVEEALRRALEDRDWQVRQAAEDLLRE